MIDQQEEVYFKEYNQMKYLKLIRNAQLILKASICNLSLQMHLQQNCEIKKIEFIKINALERSRKKNQYRNSNIALLFSKGCDIMPSAQQLFQWINNYRQIDHFIEYHLDKQFQPKQLFLIDAEEQKNEEEYSPFQKQIAVKIQFTKQQKKIVLNPIKCSDSLDHLDDLVMEEFHGSHDHFKVFQLPQFKKPNLSSKNIGSSEQQKSANWSQMPIDNCQQQIQKRNPILSPSLKNTSVNSFYVNDQLYGMKKILKQKDSKKQIMPLLQASMQIIQEEINQNKPMEEAQQQYSFIMNNGGSNNFGNQERDFDYENKKEKCQEMNQLSLFNQNRISEKIT